MPTILLFHHVQGLTSSVTAIADTLRAAGHAVHTPDLLDNRQFASIPEGMAYLKTLGFGTVIARGTEAAGAHPEADVVIGMSMGVMPAQYLAQTREGIRGAVFLHGAAPVTEFSPVWPKHVPVQIHAMDGDPEFVDSGDIDAARELVGQADNGDNSLADYDAEAAALVTERVLGFLAML